MIINLKTDAGENILNVLHLLSESGYKFNSIKLADCGRKVIINFEESACTVECQTTN